MQIIRTAAWVVLAALLLAFIAVNSAPVQVVLLPQGLGDIAVQSPVGIIAIVFFLAGLLPMWLLSKAGRWRLKRRIISLENAARAATPTPPQIPHDHDPAGD